ncbi:hypothetical protein SAMN02745823_01455 [Sporobacter termitidis DSM 10068]|uniref:Uncharacterized protein n=1 Tax=Sporobacter termitidis DSM 10068 TaxID=1123282 RepID=A0A1M5WXM2_9FIRM|nr:hypothetical protein [Sporobacter termitidis]SHH92416.1 hypothetical protein SAMN02745823_01455 [Sporobacter termitidis DSM 10068]
MLFARHIPPSCAYCRFGNPIGDGEVACTKRGISSLGSSCRKFSYDPLKREPERPQFLDRQKISEELSEDDFEL